MILLDHLFMKTVYRARGHSLSEEGRHTLQKATVSEAYYAII